MPVSRAPVMGFCGGGGALQAMGSGRRPLACGLLLARRAFNRSYANRREQSEYEINRTCESEK